MNDLNWKAVVTGASRGLGAALLGELARRGASVVGVARGREALEAVVARVTAGGGLAWALEGDVADKDGTHRLAGQAQALVGPVDLVIHNASALGPTPLRGLLDTDCEDLARVLETNLVGPFRLTKALVGPMVMRGRGTVLFLSSDAAVEPYPTWGAYSASKAATDQLARVWAAELVGTGVRVLSVDPGEMDTQMHRDAMPEADRSTLLQPAEVAQRVLRLLEDGTVKSGARVLASAFGGAR